MFCTKCGQRLLDTAKFCTGCGKPSGDTATGEAEVKPPPNSGAASARPAGPPADVGRPAPTPADSAQVSPVAGAPEQHGNADVVDFEPVVHNRQSGRRSRNVVIAGVIGVLVVAGLTGYALSRRIGVSSGAGSGAAPLLKGATIWDHLDPKELTAAQRAFDQRIADEEREAAARLSRTTQ
jgi:hypothetical protein